MQPRFRLVMVAAAAVALLASVPAAVSAAPADHLDGLRPLPHRLYAPYYESYLAPDTPSITATAKASGARFTTIAFLQSKGTKSCAVDWNSTASQPLTYYNADIASLRKLGGNIIPSFGGYSADTFGSHDHGTEIADSCTSVQRIAAVYEQVVQTLRVTRLDMDVESNAETYWRASTGATRRSRSRNGGRHSAESGCRSSSRCRWNRTGWVRPGYQCCETPSPTAYGCIRSTSWFSTTTCRTKAS